jgi:hypothetical protein
MIAEDATADLVRGQVQKSVIMESPQRKYSRVDAVNLYDKQKRDGIGVIYFDNI